MAPDELVSIFGGDFTNSAAAPRVIVKIADSAGVTRGAPPLLVSAAQINFAIPGETALGPATVTVTSAAGITFSLAIPITLTAPGLFAANGGGQGVAAAQLVRVGPDGSQSTESVAVFDSSRKEWVAAPIDMGAGSLYLVLFGTGIRHRADNAEVTCRINGQTAAVVYSGPQPSFTGLDQVNVRLPDSLRGSGEVEIVVAVDGQTSNAVTVAFR